MVSISQGWRLFGQALIKSRYGSLEQAAEWMYKLNVFARSLDSRHPIVDQIYELKNKLIKYLYQHGYSSEVRLHHQKRFCYSCSGTGVYWTGEDCWKCDGTGVFAVTQLYAFRFSVNGHSYSWHQLGKLLDYPVLLTDTTPGPFVEGLRRDDAILSLQEVWLGCCVVWWCLLLHGRLAELLLFESTHYRIKMIIREF